MTEEQERELHDIMQEVLDISAALRVMVNIADEEDTGLGILLSWTQEKAAKTGDRLDGFLMKTHTIQEDEQ